MKAPRGNIPTFTMLLAACCASLSLAASPKPPENDDGAPVAEGGVEESAKSADTPAADDDAALLKAVDPRTSHESSAEIDRLEQAIEGMRSAQKRIAGSDTSRETRKIQERVVQDLEELLAFLKRQRQDRRNSPQGRRRNQEEAPSQASRDKLRKEGGDPRNSESKKEKDSDPGDPQSGRRADKSRDSQERSDAARALEAENSRRTALLKDVWGHLPPHLREAMQTHFSDRFLPKYEDLVKTYYETLAEKNRKRTDQ